MMSWNGVEMKVDPKTVVFAVCGTCGKEIIRGEKRKLVNSSWNHLSCVIPQTNANAEALLSQLSAMLKPQVAEGVTLEEVEAVVEERLNALSLPRPVTFHISNVPPVTISGVHKQMEDILFWVSQGKHVYLYGAPGGGKSHAARQAAEILGRKFGFFSLNPQSPESRILGLVDAHGNYRPSIFRKAYQEGWIFCADEMDNASANVLTTCNSMLENGHGAFPDDIIARHEQFTLVACGNTNGLGGNPSFPERRAMDAAFRERFVFIEWQYDADLEKQITLGIWDKAVTWLSYIWKLRIYCKDNHPKLVVSPRSSYLGAIGLRSKRPIEKVVNEVIFKGLDADTCNSILSDNPLPKF